MKYRTLGRSGIKVSPLCLGAMMFGGPTDEPTAGRIIAKARETGLNMIDTADQYHAGRSEEIVGRAVRPCRDDWIVATKVANAMGTGPNRSGLSRRWMFQAVDASLKRLGLDHIDVLFLHREDHDTALEVTISAVGDLIRSGKVRGFGLSNFRAWRVAWVCSICDRLGVDRPIASQPYYNAMNRMPEVEHLPACAELGLGVVPYSPLARGVLTGKYDPKASPSADTRAGRNDRRMMEAEWRPESLAIAQTIRRHAEAKGTTASRFALNWVLNNKLVSAAIVGPRTEDQLDDYIAALADGFDAEDEGLIDGLVPAGHPSTPGYTDPHYPIEGRVPWTDSPAGAHASER